MDDGEGHGMHEAHPLHELLLSVAGRVDDDLLAAVRELIAVGEEARAVQLLVAELVAGRVVLATDAHTALTAAARRTGAGPLDALPAPVAVPPDPHRFRTPDPDDDMVVALRDLPETETVAAVRLAHRITPAGSAPGPLPHPVVLVDAGSDWSSSSLLDVLAYRWGAALQRRGLLAAVEVLPDGADLPAYHAAAAAAALLVSGVPVADRRTRSTADGPGGTGAAGLLGESDGRRDDHDAFGTGADLLDVRRPGSPPPPATGAVDIPAVPAAPAAPPEPRPVPRRLASPPPDGTSASWSVDGEVDRSVLSRPVPDGAVAAATTTTVTTATADHTDPTASPDTTAPPDTAGPRTAIAEQADPRRTSRGAEWTPAWLQGEPDPSMAGTPWPSPLGTVTEPARTDLTPFTDRAEPRSGARPSTAAAPEPAPTVDVAVGQTPDGDRSAEQDAARSDGAPSSGPGPADTATGSTSGRRPGSGPGEPGATEDEWSGQWRSGDWAVRTTGRGSTPLDPGPEPAPTDTDTDIDGGAGHSAAADGPATGGSANGTIAPPRHRARHHLDDATHLDDSVHLDVAARSPGDPAEAPGTGAGPHPSGPAGAPPPGAERGATVIPLNAARDGGPGRTRIRAGATEDRGSAGPAEPGAGSDWTGAEWTAADRGTTRRTRARTAGRATPVLPGSTAGGAGAIGPDRAVGDLFSPRSDVRDASTTGAVSGAGSGDDSGSGEGAAETEQAGTPTGPADRVDPARAPGSGSNGSDRLGLRAESLARLSDADRDLLSRLQSELRSGRIGRARPGTARTEHDPDRPPDLAG